MGTCGIERGWRPAVVVGAFVVFAMAVSVAHAQALPSTEPGASDLGCVGVLDVGVDLGPMLARVPKFSRTYVLVYADGGNLGLARPATTDESARIGAHEGSPAVGIVAETYGRPAVLVPVVPADPARLVRAVLDGELDAAVLWAPLAGLGVGQLDFDYALSLLTLGLPRPPPAGTKVADGTANAAALDPHASCADEIRGLLEGYGVIAAEQRVPVDIASLLALAPRPRDAAAARAGAPLYAQHCAQCHGPEGVAAPDALAPVDLIRSVQRFSWPGFSYVVQVGRQQNGMPGFRGALAAEEIERIYQYARERAHGTILPSQSAHAETAAAPPGSTEPP